jgi:hypothetical protein
MAVILFPAAAFAGTDVRTAAPGASPPPAKIDALAWMAGDWIGTGFGGEVEEVYSAPSNGVMLAHFRMSKGDKPKIYEFETVSEKDGSLVYRVKHFDPDLKGWEEKDKYVEFPLVAIEGNRTYFDGLTIERGADGSLVNYLEIEHNDGTREEVTLRYHRVR